MIKKLLLSLLLLFSLTSYLHAGTVTLAWDANSEDDLAGYKLYYTNETVSPIQFISIDVGNVLQYTVDPVLENVQYCYKLTAYDTNGNESGYSNEVHHIVKVNWDTDDKIPPAPPTNGDGLRVISTTTIVKTTITSTVTR